MPGYAKSSEWRRWKLAQDQQRINQLLKKSRLEKNDPGDLAVANKVYAAEILKILERFKKVTDKTRILEVGSGPHGINFFLPRGSRVSMDPLALLYDREFEFLQRSPRVDVLAGMGENIPFRDGSFDWVFCDNVLDHVLSPAEVLSEISRVADERGRVFLAVRVHHFIYRLFNLVFILFFRLGLTPKTPNYKAHTTFFTIRKLKRLLKRQGLPIVHFHLSKSAPRQRGILKRLYKNWTAFFVCGGKQITIKQEVRE